jgi:hypothetical protein
VINLSGRPNEGDLMRFLAVIAIAGAVAAFAWPALRGLIRALPALPFNNVLIACGLAALAVVLLILASRAER